MLAHALLSGSTGGLGIKVAATATPGTDIHSTGTSASVVDKVNLFATNSDPAAKKLTIEFGGVAAPDNTIEMTIPGESGMVPILENLPLVGTGGAARTVKAFCETANVVMIYGYVDRIS